MGVMVLRASQVSPCAMQAAQRLGGGKRSARQPCVPLSFTRHCCGHYVKDSRLLHSMSSEFSQNVAIPNQTPLLKKWWCDLATPPPPSTEKSINKHSLPNTSMPTKQKRRGQTQAFQTLHPKPKPHQTILIVHFFFLQSALP